MNGDPEQVALLQTRSSICAKSSTAISASRPDAERCEMDLRRRAAAVYDDDETDASKVTRDYRLELAAPRRRGRRCCLYSAARSPPIAAWQTRRMTETACHSSADSSRMDCAGARCRAETLPHADFAAFLARRARRAGRFCPQALACRLARSYGTRIERYSGGARAACDELGEHFGAGLTEAEVSYLRTHEWARTLTTFSGGARSSACICRR